MNLFDLPPLPIAEELTDILASTAHTRVERIISAGQTSGWYDQPEAEFVALLQGRATIEYEDKRPVRLAKGDTLLIPAHERHRVSETSAEPPCVWLCVFMGGQGTGG